MVPCRLKEAGDPPPSFCSQRALSDFSMRAPKRVPTLGLVLLGTFKALVLTKSGHCRNLLKLRSSDSSCPFLLSDSSSWGQ